MPNHLIRDWTCINECPIFRTITIPQNCPHCGTPEVYPSSEAVTKYEQMDESYINEHYK